VTLVPNEDIARVVLCSGKVYYDLLEEREKRGETRIQLFACGAALSVPRSCPHRRADALS